jgi:histidinol phosphatase-like enzyme (inositol monophosphatase family)
MNRNEIDALAAFACELADAARTVTLAGAAGALAAEDKNEGGAFDPVTETDRGAERAIRALIEERFPDHGISGEEYGEARTDADLVWSLDPIDGTRAFVCGMPGWTTLIALLRGGAPVIGLIDAPVLGERYLGHGATGRLFKTGGETALAASACATLGEARLATTDPYLFHHAEADSFARLRRAVRLTRYGFDAYAYGRLAAGTIDLVAESGLKPHDYNALVPVIRAAGGVIGNWRGEQDFAQGQVLAAATPRLFEAAVAALAH